MLIRETDTDFDEHIAKLEDEDGEVFFFDVNDNPARFQRKVVEDVLGIMPKRVVLLFHWGVGEKKARSIARSTARKLTRELDTQPVSVNVFILPPALFIATQTEANRHSN